MTDLLSQLQSVDPPALTAVALAAASLVLVVREPVAGRRAFTRFLAAEAAEGEPARLRFYRSWTLQGCAAAALAVLLVLALPGVGLADIGFRWPTTSGLESFSIAGGSFSSSLVSGFVAGALGSVLVVAVALAVRIVRSRRPGKSPSPAPVAEPRGQMIAILPMLPRSRAGRRGWAGLSLSAGITEEITYRGLLLLTLVVALPAGTPVVALLAVAAVMFGIAHWYQGWTGVVSTGLFGAVMAVLYVATGSLLLPMVVHTLVDLRALLLSVPAEVAAPSTGAHAADENLHPPAPHER